MAHCNNWMPADTTNNGHLAGEIFSYRFFISGNFLPICFREKRKRLIRHCRFDLFADHMWWSCVCAQLSVNSWKITFSAITRPFCLLIFNQSYALVSTEIHLASRWAILSNQQLFVCLLYVWWVWTTWFGRFGGQNAVIHLYLDWLWLNEWVYIQNKDFFLCEDASDSILFLTGIVVQQNVHSFEVCAVHTF